MTDKQLVYAIYDDEQSAQGAVDHFVEAEFDIDEITILSRELGGGDDAQIERLPVEEHTHGRDGATIGAAIGAVGGIALAVVGPWGGAGALLIALSAALGGGATGGAMGLLAGLGWEDDDIDFDAEHFPPEAFLVGVITTKRIDAAREVHRAAGAKSVFTRTPDMAAEEFRHLRDDTGERRLNDPVDEAGRQSFPASDPPPWTRSDV